LKQSWQRWKTLPAVKSGRVQVVDGDLISRPSQRIVLGLEALARLFHPEVLP
jgi:iron complex transport system substrate-binding protein